MSSTVVTTLSMDIPATSTVVASKTPVHEASEQSSQTTPHMRRIRELKNRLLYVRDRDTRCFIFSFVFEHKLRDMLKTFIEHKRTKLTQQHRATKKWRKIPVRDTTTPQMYRIRDLKHQKDNNLFSVSDGVARCGNVVISFVFNHMGFCGSLKLRDILKTLIEHKRTKLFRQHRATLLKTAYKTWIDGNRVGVEPRSDAFVSGSMAIAKSERVCCIHRYIVEHIIDGKSIIYVYDGK